MPGEQLRLLSELVAFVFPSSAPGWCFVWSAGLCLVGFICLGTEASGENRVDAIILSSILCVQLCLRQDFEGTCGVSA